MKVHSTNYVDTFIEVAEDIRVDKGTRPASKPDKKTVAELQYEMLSDNSYQYTSDEILFDVFAIRNDLTKDEFEPEREKFFSKGHACFRSSPLTKNYGFGIQNNSEGKIALYGMKTEEYQKFLHDASIKKVKAMRSSK